MIGWRGRSREATRYLKEIAANHSPHVIDLVAQLIHVLYTRAYGEALHYDRGKLERIYELTQRHPVVFLPSHKSNLDHLVLQYMLHENGHPPNHTAGGINMNFFPVGPLVRRSGVFFIRRTFKDNALYKLVLRHYVDYLIEKRFSLEWYIEGGRSRSGKLLPPRFGMLAYVVDAYRRGKSDDVVLIPVSIAYDQISDVPDYAAEQSGAMLGFLWGGLVRILLVHHITWSVNSVCHLWGTRPFRSHDESRNNPVVGILAFGEGWHNNHHAFPTSARHGLRWWQIDVSYLFIRLLALLGLAWNVKVPGRTSFAH